MCATEVCNLLSKTNVTRAFSLRLGGHDLPKCFFRTQVQLCRIQCTQRVRHLHTIGTRTPRSGSAPALSIPVPVERALCVLAAGPQGLPTAYCLARFADPVMSPRDLVRWPAGLRRNCWSASSSPPRSLSIALLGCPGSPRPSSVGCSGHQRGARSAGGQLAFRPA